MNCKFFSIWPIVARIISPIPIDNKTDLFSPFSLPIDAKANFNESILLILLVVINFLVECFRNKDIKFKMIKENIDPKINQRANVISGEISKIIMIRVKISPNI